MSNTFLTWARLEAASFDRQLSHNLLLKFLAFSGDSSTTCVYHCLQLPPVSWPGLRPCLLHLHKCCFGRPCSGCEATPACIIVAVGLMQAR